MALQTVAEPVDPQNSEEVFRLINLAGGDSTLVCEKVVFRLNGFRSAGIGNGGGGISVRLEDCYFLNNKEGNQELGVGMSLGSGGAGGEIGTSTQISAPGIRIDRCVFAVGTGIWCISSGPSHWVVTDSIFHNEVFDIILRTNGESGLKHKGCYFARGVVTGSRDFAFAPAIREHFSFHDCTFHIDTPHPDDGSRIAIDMSRTPGGASVFGVTGIQIEDCLFHSRSSDNIGIKGKANDPIPIPNNTIIKGNLFHDFTANNEIVDIPLGAASNNEICHNLTNSGAILPDTCLGHVAPSAAGSGQQTGGGEISMGSSASGEPIVA